MGELMKTLPIALLLLQSRLRVMRIGAAPCVSLILCLSGLAAWGWVLVQQAAQVGPRQPQTVAMADVPAIRLPSGAENDDNLGLFYATVGDPHSVEQQVKTLFALAARAGVDLKQGEYKFGYDQAGRVTTYQISLPVKGAYQAIWQFGLDVLRVMAFASLDEIHFKREDITDAAPEARLRFTLYFSSPAMAVQP